MLKQVKERGYSMERLYAYLGVTRQALHQQQKAMLHQTLKEQEILRRVRDFRENHSRMGSRCLYYSLGIKRMGVTKFEELMSRNNLTVPVKRKRIKTTDSKGSKYYPNLINGKILTGINQLIVADITYYHTVNQMLYIFTLKDVYSQRILSLRASDNMKALNALKTLDDFVKVRGSGPFPFLIHHSDNGKQYDATVFKAELAKLEIQISRAGNSLENGSSESLNNIIKNHYLYDHSQIKNVKQLQKALDELKWKLNNEKAIKSLGYRTVVDFERYILSLAESERPVKKLYDFEKNGKS